MFGLPKVVFPIYGIALLDVLGLTILIPMLPVLSAKYHTQPSVVGAALGTTALAATISSPFWGYASDRYGRKFILLASQACSTIGYTMLALTGNLELLFVSRAIEGLGGGNLGVAQSYIADVTDEEDREKAFAFGAAAFGIGFVIGPVLAGLLLQIDTSLPFWVAAGLQVGNLALTWFFLPNTTSQPSEERAEGSSVRAILTQLRKPPLSNLMARQFLYIFSFVYFFTIFSEYLQTVLQYGPTQSSLFLAVAGAIGAFVQIFLVDRLEKRLGAFVLSEAGLAVGFVAYALMFFMNGLAMFLTILVIWAASGSVLRPTLNKLISTAAPPENRGAILGFGDSLSNASMIFAPAIGGIVLGIDPKLIGIPPACFIAAAFVLGLAGRRGTKPDYGQTTNDSR